MHADEEIAWYQIKHYGLIHRKTFNLKIQSESVKFERTRLSKTWHVESCCKINKEMFKLFLLAKILLTINV